MTDHLNVVLGFTALELEGEDGADIYDWVPRRTLNLSLTSRIPALPAVTLGLNGRWQSDIATVDGYTGGAVRQGSYATANVFARWDVTPRTTVRANINNVGDEKYIGSLYQVGFYAPPRNYALSASWQFRPTSTP